MLVIGGSTTAERYIDDNDLWTTRLGVLLSQADCPIAIANAGLEGHSTVGHIASFDGWLDRIPRLKPRFILAYIGINDAEISARPAWYDDTGRWHSKWRQFAHYVLARSAINGLYRRLHGWWQAREAGLLYGQAPLTPSPIWKPASLPADFETAVSEKVQAYRQRLARLNQVIHQFAAQPIYVTQKRIDGRLVDGAWQQFPGSDGARSGATLAAINRATLDFCRDQGEICVDLAGQIDFTPSDFGDGVHTKPAGSVRIARFLAAALRPVLCGAR
jgi:lysophospholipase L1-like esterase